MFLDGLKATVGSFRSSITDTTFVLFFLGLEFGRTLQTVTFDGLLLAVTMLMVALLPYYLPSESPRQSLGRWAVGRGLIALLAVITGAALRPAYGTLLPESFRFLPLTLLIITAMTSSFLQFYGLMRLRLAK